MLSDVDAEFVTALRLPTFHAGGRDHLKRLTLVVDPGRVVQAVQFPIADPAGSVREALAVVQKPSRGRTQVLARRYAPPEIAPPLSGRAIDRTLSNLRRCRVPPRYGCPMQTRGVIGG